MNKKKNENVCFSSRSSHFWEKAKNKLQKLMKDVACWMLVRAKEKNNLGRGGCEMRVSGTVVVVIFWDWYSLHKDTRVNWASFPADGWLSECSWGWCVRRPAICVEILPALPLVTLVNNCWSRNCCVCNSMTSLGKLAAPTSLDWIVHFFGSYNCGDLW